MIQLLLNKTTPHFQLLPMSKVDQSQLRVHEALPLTVSEKSKNTEFAFTWSDSPPVFCPLLCAEYCSKARYYHGRIVQV